VTNRLYVGNLSFQSSEDAIAKHFAGCGQVVSVSVVMDRETGQPRGFAFVEMSSASEAQKAVNELNGKELQGRSLRVDIAQERQRGGGGGGGGGRSGGGGRRGGGDYGGGGRRGG
jgi:cold-inducible RNA-binding protein